MFHGRFRTHNYQNTIVKQQFIFLLKTAQICPTIVEIFLTAYLFPISTFIFWLPCQEKPSTVLNENTLFVVNDRQGKTQKMGSSSYVVVIFHVV